MHPVTKMKTMLVYPLANWFCWTWGSNPGRVDVKQGCCPLHLQLWGGHLGIAAGNIQSQSSPSSLPEHWMECSPGTVINFTVFNGTSLKSLIVPISCCPVSETSSSFRHFLSTEVSPACPCPRPCMHPKIEHTETMRHQKEWPYFCVIFRSHQKYQFQP